MDYADGFQLKGDGVEIIYKNKGGNVYMRLTHTHWFDFISFFFSYIDMYVDSLQLE